MSEERLFEVASDAETLAERWGVPPFSILDTRSGDWRQRRTRWVNLGIESEIGRDGNLLKLSETMLRETGSTGTSIFDPVLCELAYRWFSPPGGLVLDPFAGGSVRGIVAGALGRVYVGLDLSERQVEANREQADRIRGLREEPEWICADSRTILPARELAIDVGAYRAYDMVFTCPPYGFLEQYSDDPRDLSTMSWPRFLEAYGEIITAACGLLRKNRFAAIVVSEVRDPNSGAYLGFVPATIEAFRKAGLSFINEAVLINSAGSIALRAHGSFSNSRKLGRCHQNVLVFCKGSAEKAAEACGREDLADDE